MQRWIPWLTGVLIIAGLIWTYIFLKYVHPPGDLSPWKNRDPLSGLSVRFKDTELTIWDDGKKTWRFNADSIELSKDRQTAVCEGRIRGDLLESGRKTASFTAKKIVFNTFTQNLTVPGNVSIILSDGPRIKTGKLYWNRRKNKLVCDAGVDAVFPVGIFHGKRITLDLRKKEATVYKIYGTIKLNEEMIESRYSNAE